MRFFKPFFVCHLTPRTSYHFMGGEGWIGLSNSSERGEENEVVTYLAIFLKGGLANPGVIPIYCRSSESNRQKFG